MAAPLQGIEQAQRFGSLQEEAFLTLTRSADSLHRAFQHLLKPFGLTATQYNVLRILRCAALSPEPFLQTCWSNAFAKLPAARHGSITNQLTW